MRWKAEARAVAVRVRKILSGKRKARFDTPGLGVALIALLVTVLLYVGSARSGRPGPAPEPAPRPETPVLSAALAPEPRLEPSPVAVPEDAAADGCPEGCTVPPPGCAIKGNISQRTGERIYHLPAQQYYDRTAIRPGDGERWFCAEREARANGWRKSKR